MCLNFSSISRILLFILCLCPITACQTTQVGPTGGGPDFKAAARPAEDLLAAEIARALNAQAALASGQLSHRLEISQVYFDLTRREGFDLSYLSVKGPYKTATLVDPFKNQEYKVFRPEETAQASREPYMSYTGKMSCDYKMINNATNAVTAQGRSEVQGTWKYGGLLGAHNLIQPLTKAPDSSQAREIAQKELAASLALAIKAELPTANREHWLLDSGQDKETVRGVKEAQAGNWAEAQIIWAQVLTLNPDYPPALYNQGIARERLNTVTSLREARELYKKAQLKSGNLLYRDALTRVTARLNELGEPLDASFR